MSETLEIIKAEELEIPDYLAPLFIHRDDPTRQISRMFMNSSNLWNGSIDDFTEILTTKSDEFYKYAYEFIFGNTETEENYIVALEIIDASVEYKLQVSMLLGSFSYAMGILAALMKRVYRCVDEPHRRHREELEAKFREIDSEDNRQLNLLIMKRSSVDFSRVTVSICLLCQELVMTNIRGDDVFLLFGFYYKEGIENRIDGAGISAENFIICCGNKLRLKILRTIAEKGELTSSKIAGILSCPVTTTIRHMKLLSENNLIKVSRRQGLSVYYEVNVRLFKKMQREVYKLLEAIINDGKSK